jgi:hypothetical protein
MRNFFFMAAIAIPQLEGRVSAIVKQRRLFKAVLLRNCNRAISLF